jgi:outer membrane protein assembly factor BamA
VSLLLRVATLFVMLALSTTFFACTTIPKGAASVDDVDVEGNEIISSSSIEEKMATTPTEKFLGLFRGVMYDYSLFDRSVLQRDLERVERYLQARGFYEAKARAGRIVFTSDDHVEVTVEVEEGPRVVIEKISVEGDDELDAKETKAVEKAVASALSVDDPFEEEPYKHTETSIKRALTDRGYAWAKVERHAEVDLPKHKARLQFVVTPGPKATFGAIDVSGVKELPKRPIIKTMLIDPGDAYSTAKIDEARDAILGLGTFSSVEVVPELGSGPTPDRVVPLHVKVREQRLRGVLLGGGTQLDSIRFQLHLQAGWEHRNFFGGFRHFSVDVKPTVDLYPTRIPSFGAPTSALPGERFRVRLRQPGFLEPRTTGTISQELNTYPVLLSQEVDADAPVIGYFEYKGAVGLERGYWKFFFNPTYNLQYNLPFAYQGVLDPDLSGVAVAYIGGLASFDYRDDRTKPHKGVFIQNDIQFAGVGGEALDIRIQPEVRGYIPLGHPKVTVAVRGSVGFLFPFNYGDDTKRVRDGQQPSSRREWIEDIEITYLRGFFSGGPNSNRGYPLRGVGPHGIVPFFNPGLAEAQIANACDAETLTEEEKKRCGVPLGGLSLWEASLELRYPIYDPLSGTVFCDAGDVSAEQLKLRFDYLHLSCGGGLRYDTPIGPIRIDIGVRIPGAQYPADANEVEEGDPGTFFGATIPVAFSFGIGEAF